MSCILRGLPWRAFERCEHLRRVPSWVEKLRSHPNAQLLVFQSENALVGPAQELSIPLASAPPQCADVLVGVYRDATDLGPEAIPIFACRRAEGESVTSFLLSDGPSSISSTTRQYLPLRRLATQFDDSLYQIVSFGKSLTEWHVQHPFCPKCGSKTNPSDVGYTRTCEGCKAMHYPRVNPCAIMLVLDDQGRCLLAKHHGRPWFTTLAGYVAQGESLEECVEREVKEETGVTVTRIAYFKSQFFPFPYQLMLGCVAQAANTDLVIDEKELEHAGWFTKEEVLKALNRDPESKIIVPPTFISNQLMRSWVEGKLELLLRSQL